MDEKDSKKDFDKDFDYDYYAIKYGIDLRGDLTDEELNEPEKTERPARGSRLAKPVKPSKPEKAESNPKQEKSARPAAAEKPVRPDIRQRTDKAPEKKNGGSSVRMELYDWLQCVVSAILCGILIFVFAGRIIGVDGTSMLQTLQNQDKVVMSDLFFKPSYGDIVVIKTDTFGDTPIVKRVIATAGQTIDINFATGDVMIDGMVINENYINAPTTEQEDFQGPVTVGDGYVFVMGDNRNASTDSRSSYVGLVDTRQILGKVLFVLIPGKEADGTRDMSRIGSVYRVKTA
jgi:signal peptidase I